MRRPGYYVEGKYFGIKAAQAHAFAQFRANEYGREVIVTLTEFDGDVHEIATMEPRNQAVAA